MQQYDIMLSKWKPVFQSAYKKKTLLNAAMQRDTVVSGSSDLMDCFTPQVHFGAAVPHRGMGAASQPLLVGALPVIVVFVGDKSRFCHQNKLVSAVPHSWRGFVAWIGVHDTVAPHGLVSEQYLVTAQVSAPTFTMQTHDGSDAPRRKLELGA